jgi:hypothetical protein
MSQQTFSSRPVRRPMLLEVVSTAVAVLLQFFGAVGTVHGQVGGGFGFGGQAVGGISVDAKGIVRNLEPKASDELAGRRRETLANSAVAKGGPAALRKVSLARVIDSLKQSIESGKPLPPEVLFLGGLERITHLFVDPEGHDIILAGPADAGFVDGAGNVVAVVSRRPLLQLEDLIVALRAIDGARAGGMRCSIDPEAEGIAKLQQYLRGVKNMSGDPDAVLRAMENALGPQKVTVGGVPGESRMARVLVAADYRMKRIGMGLEPSGIAELPSYVSMLPPGATSNATLPRFWLEASYDPIVRDPDELAWQINGRRMKCLTESDIFLKNGVERGKGSADSIARKWCDVMSTHYEKLSLSQPVFAELVNCVDLAVVAALIHGRQLDKRAGIDLGLLLDPGTLRLPAYDVPTTLPTVASGMKKGNRWVVTASGGVQFQPWGFASATVESGDAAVGRTKALAARPADAWWWD